MPRQVYILLFLLLLCFSCRFAWSAEIPPIDDNVHIKADTMDHGPSPGMFTASGNVVVTWQGLTLTAQTASYDSNSRILKASGQVNMSKGKDVLKGEAISLNIETGRGEVSKATLAVPDSSLNVSGDRIVRINESEFEISVTELTTCDLPDPDWKFGADKIKVNILGYATGRNIFFYVKGVPVLYLPWIAFPVVREKKSGVLLPRVGYSNSRGAQLDIPLYWVISHSQDLLFDLDLLSKRGVGTGLDYRYIRIRGSEGHLGGYQIYDLRQDRLRWQISQSHKEIFSPDMNVRMDVNLNSDRTFLNDFGDKSGEYNRQSSDTTMNALKSWQNYALTASVRYTEDLYAQNNLQTLQTLPELGVAGVRQRLFAPPLYLDLDATLANYYRESGENGQRAHLFPRVTLIYSPFSFLHTSFFAGAHLRGYNSGNGSETDGIRRNDGNLLPEAGGRISTSMARIYQLDLQHQKKLRHEIIPELSYGYRDDRSQQRLPFYDYTDRLVWQNMLQASVTSLLNGRFEKGGTSEYRDISRLKLTIGYSFEGGRRELLTLVDDQRNWSNLALESDTWLHKQVRMTFDARYNLYDNRVVSAAAGVEYDDLMGNLASASYRMARNELEYLEGRVGTRLLKPWAFSYSARYSFDRGDFLESVYSAEYRHKCWSVVLALHERPGNLSVNFNFNLAGLTGK